MTTKKDTTKKDTSTPASGFVPYVFVEFEALTRDGCQRLQLRIVHKGAGKVGDRSGDEFVLEVRGAMDAMGQYGWTRLAPELHDDVFSMAVLAVKNWAH